MLELISLHIPKCGGTTLRQGLINIYGKDAVYMDYDDNPGNPTSIASIDPEGHIRNCSQDTAKWAGRKAIHGHFYLPKYRALDAPRITILRHPAPRLVSHYFYWRAHARHNHPIHNYFMDNHLDILSFAKLPAMRYFYSGIFLRDVNKADFDFIGRSENMESAMAAIGKIIGKTIDYESLNENTTSEYATKKHAILENPNVMALLQDILHKDITLYEQWCQT